MKLYKHIIAATAILLGVTACSEDRELDAERASNSKLVPIAIGANFAPSTRTSMNSDGDVLWSASDQIKVQVGENNYDFDLTSGSGTTSATFAGVVTEDDAAILKGTTAGTVTAYYPTSGTAVAATQTYATNTFADNMNPMTATNTAESGNPVALTFTNNAAVVRVQGVAASAQTAVLSYTVSEANYSVTMSSLPTTAAKDLYFVVVPGAQEFSLSLDGGVATKYVASETTAAGSRYNIEAPKVAKTQTGSSTYNEYTNLGDALTYLNDNTDYNNYKSILLMDTETGASYTSENPMYVVKTKSSKTLDLDGKTLTVTNPSSLVLNSYNYLIGNGGTIKAANAGDVALVVKDAPSGKTGYGIPTNITIDGAVVYDNSYQIISDGTVINGDISLTNNSNIYIYGGTFGGALSADLGSAFTITGGTFSQDPSAYVSLPYVATKTGDVWVVAEKQYDYVAQIGENKYTTLAAAFSAVTANQTIQLIGCTTITSGITVSKTCTLDLNGFVISDNTSKLFTTSGSITFTITDNSANHDGKITTTASTPSSCEFVHMEFSSPKLIVNNGVFDMKASNGMMFNCQGTGAMCDINGGHFISGGTQTMVVHYYQNTSYNNQITGGTFEAVSVNGSQAKLIDMGGTSGSKYITVTISGGTFSESGSQTQIFNGFKMSKVIIKKVDGRDEPEFSCTNKIFSGVITVDISAGKFTGSGSFFSSPSGTNTAHSVISGGTFHYTNANKWASSGIFELNCTEQYFDITGGTFTSDVIYKIFYLYAPSNKKVISVRGGTFTENPAEAYRNYYNSKTGPFNLVASGYVSTPNGTSPETWTVTEDVK